MKNKSIKKWVAGCMAAAFLFTGVVTDPVIASAASKTVTVKTQKQLDAALKDKKVTNIVIKTSNTISLKIKDGDYGKKSLSVSAPKATINNYGDFKKITVADGKSLTDRGDGNNIVVNDKNSLKLTTGKQSKDTKVTISGKNGKINIVNNGDISKINVKSKSTVKLSGSSKESPVITNNAKSAEITTTMNADIVLNKPATLVVGGKAEIGSLTANANATISVHSSATVKEATISGKAADVVLNVNGTVGNVAVNTKADLTISGNTETSVPVTTNVAGASITSTVQTDLTANADTSVDFKQGAEGSTVKTSNESVKTEVSNNTTDKIAITDSKGNEATVDSGKTETTTPSTDTSNKNDSNKNESAGGGGGGSSSSSSSSSSSDSGSSWYPSGGGSSSQTPAVTVTPTISRDVEAVSTDTKIYLDDILVASAACSTAGDHEYSYTWYVDNKVVATGREYHVYEEAIGKSIKLVASTTINGNKVDGNTITRAVMIPIYASRYIDNVEVCVTSGTSLSDVKAELGSDAMVFDHFGNSVPSAKIEWTAPENFDSSVATAYKFAGSITVDLEKYAWVHSEQANTARTVRVLGNNLAEFNMSLATDDALAGDNSGSVSIASDGSGINYIISGNHLTLDTVAPNGLPNGKHIALDLDFGKDVSGQVKFGTNADLLDTVNESSGSYAVTTATNSAIRVYVNVAEAYYNCVTYYVTVGDGDITPIRFYVESEDVTAGDLKTDLSGPYEFTVEEFNPGQEPSILPMTLEYAIVEDAEHTAEVKVAWICDKKYWLAAGTYTFTAVRQDDAPINISRLPSITVVLNKNDCSGVTPSAISADTITTTTNSVTFPLYWDLEYAVLAKSLGSVDLNNVTKWYKDIDTIDGLDADTEYYLIYRWYETAIDTASGYTVSEFKTCKVLPKPIFEPITKTAIYYNDAVTTPATLDCLYDFLMFKTDAVAVEYNERMQVTWVCNTDKDFPAVGTYVYTAEPDGDYSSSYDLSDVVWPTVTVTIKDSSERPAAPVKSLDSTLCLFGDDRIGTTGREDAIVTVTEGNITTLKPNVQIKPIDGFYWLPIGVYLKDDSYDTNKLYVTNRAGAPIQIIKLLGHSSNWLQFWVVLEQNPETQIGAEFIMDYDGSEDKYAPSNIIRIDISQLGLLPADSGDSGSDADSAAPAETGTPSAIKLAFTDYAAFNDYRAGVGLESIQFEEGADSESVDRFKVTTTLNYKSNVAGFSEGYNTGYFIPVEFTVPDGMTAETITVVATGDAITEAVIDDVKENTAYMLVRSCKGHGVACQLAIDFDGEGSTYAPYVFQIDETDVTHKAPVMVLLDLPVITELPDTVSTVRGGANGWIDTSSEVNADLVNDVKFTNGAIAITATVSEQSLAANGTSRFYIVVSKGALAGVALDTEPTTAYLFDMLSTSDGRVAVDGDNVYIAHTVSFDYKGEIIDGTDKLVLNLLEAGPEGTEQAFQSYTINIAPKLVVLPSDEDTGV